MMLIIFSCASIFCEVSVQAFHLFLWVIYLLVTELQEIFIYSIYKLFVKYFLPMCDMPYHLLNWLSYCADFNFMKSTLLYFSFMVNAILVSAEKSLPLQDHEGIFLHFIQKLYILIFKFRSWPILNWLLCIVWSRGQDIYFFLFRYSIVPVPFLKTLSFSHWFLLMPLWKKISWSFSIELFSDSALFHLSIFVLCWLLYLHINHWNQAM